MRLLKKLFLGFCVFCLVILIAITAVPFFVNVDQYRPQIVQAVNERINGKLELGKLSLSLWGQIRVEVGGLKLFDTKENQIVSVKDAWFHFPFLSILSGAPTLNFKMIKPELSVVKDKNGSLNVLTLMKQPVAVDTSKTLQEGQKITPQKFELPGIVSKAVLGVEVLQALLVYRDVTLSKEPQSVKNLNLRLKNISLEQATELEIWGNIDGSKLKDTLSIRGPFRISGNARPELVQKRFDKITIDLLGNFDDIEVLVPDLFEKKKGVKAQFKAQMQSSFEKASVTAVATFFNAEFKVQGSVANFNQPQVEFSIKSNEIALNPWNSLVYSLKSYDLGGVASLEAGINGSAQQLGYKAQVQFKNVTAKAPHLKSQPQIDGAVKVSTNQIESFWVTLKAPGNDLKVQGRLVSFEKPSIEVSVVSAGIDLDQLIDFPRPSKLAKSATSADYDTMLKPMRENQFLKTMAVLVNVNFKTIKAYDVKIENLTTKFVLRDLVSNLENLSMDIWSGHVKAGMVVDLQPNSPTYQATMDVSGLDLKQAVSSQLQMFKQTIYGKAFFKMNASGSSFNPDPAIKNLNAKGFMKVEKPTFTTIDIGKIAGEALNNTVTKLGDKISSLKGKNVNLEKAKAASRYDLISSDFTIAGGKFRAPNFVAKAEPNKGIDFKGDTTVGIKDYSLKASWEVIDTYNVAHADLSVEQSGVKVEHLLAETDGGPVHFPITAGCTLLSPCYTYTEVPEFLGKIALANVSRAVADKAKAEFKQKTQEKVLDITKQATPAAQDKVKGLTKKLFGK